MAEWLLNLKSDATLQDMVRAFDEEYEEPEEEKTVDDQGNPTFYLYGVVGWHFDDSIGVELDALEEGATATIRVNSPGGDVWTGLAILSAIDRCKATTNIVVDGVAASAAAFLTLGADDVAMGPGSLMMIHNPSGFAFGEAKDMQAKADLLGTVKQSIVDLYCQRCGGDGELWGELMNVTTWFTAGQAVDAKVADRVIELASKPDQTDDPDDEEPDEEPTEEPTNLAMSEEAFAKLRAQLLGENAQAPVSGDNLEPNTITAERFRSAFLGG